MDQELDMDKFFDMRNRNTEIEDLNQNKINKIVEFGHGVGIIGHRYGSYSEYVKKLSSEKDKYIYLSNFRLDKYLKYLYNIVHIAPNTPIELLNIPIDEIINHETLKFTPREIPKLLLVSNNLINNREIFVEWKYLDKSKNTLNLELEQFYRIPLAYGMGYDWWDSYGVIFLGPENIREGGYIVDIQIKDTKLTSKSETAILKSNTSVKFLVSK